MLNEINFLEMTGLKVNEINFFRNDWNQMKLFKLNIAELL